MFRNAVSDKQGLFFLAQGINGAIYGGLTFVKVSGTFGRMVPYGPGETRIFSLSSRMVFNYTGTTGKPVITYFFSSPTLAFVGFSDNNEDWKLNFVFFDGIKFAESYTSRFG